VRAPYEIARLVLLLIAPLSFRGPLVRSIGRSTHHEAGEEADMEITTQLEALFVSALQPSDRPDAGRMHAAVARAIHEYGEQGCAARVAQEFGDHPDLAVPRMVWVRHTIDAAAQLYALAA
jgi:hypothetical protein